ncbi:hypothetical protein EJB05_43850, partial [Eragrostis curvula]
MDRPCSLYIAVVLFVISWTLCAADDRIVIGKPLSPGTTIVSDGGAFALGFFSPPGSNSSSLYLGIWYNNIPKLTVVWVADQAAPITADHSSSSSSTSASLSLTNASNLVLLDATGRVLWTTNLTVGATAVASSPSAPDSSPLAVLQNTGNLVVRSPNGTALWQSFEHPGDAYLPNMKIGHTYRTHYGVRLVSWKGPGDPSPGPFTFGADPDRPLQLVIWNGTRVHWRNSPWTGYMVDSNYQKGGGRSAIYRAVFNTDEEIYAAFTLSDGAPPMQYTLTYAGDLELQSWSNDSSSWNTIIRYPTRACSAFGYCGAFGYCDNSTDGGVLTTCRCVDGFEPASGAEWSRGNFSQGCRRKKPVRCSDGFAEVHNMKLPEGYTLVPNRSSEECAAWCMGNCSCVAYAYANLTTSAKKDSTRCLVWAGELVDMEKVVGSWGDFGETLYLRLAGAGRGKKRNAVRIVLPVLLASVLIPACIFLCLPKFKATINTCACIVLMREEMLKKINGENNKIRALRVLSAADEFGREIPAQDLELSFLEYDEIVTATDNFSEASMIGKGGFGKVYKGVLGSREVAVKRLSMGSKQGIVEFRNEVILIAKLQHRNLVRLVGCCMEGDEKLLIYEYLPNKSLDATIFNCARKSMLDWSMRFKIIKGIARGLLYLHQDSRLTIIHRDLKASNILLDAAMNPKISDFGMARIFGDNEEQANTKRAWNLWNEEKAETMIDSSIVKGCILDEVLLCIHLALLCVQENLNDRPAMPQVVRILENGSKSFAAPNRPAYFAQRNNELEHTGSSKNSNNTVTLTVLEGR